MWWLTIIYITDDDDTKIKEFNKIPIATDLVTKAGFKTKFTENEKKRPDVIEFDTKLNGNSNAVTSDTTKQLKTRQWLNKLWSKIKGCHCSIVRIYFSGDDGYQNYLVFSPMFHWLILDNKIVSWYHLEYPCKGLSQQIRFLCQKYHIYLTVK